MPDFPTRPQLSRSQPSYSPPSYGEATSTAAREARPGSAPATTPSRPSTPPAPPPSRRIRRSHRRAQIRTDESDLAGVAPIQSAVAAAVIDRGGTGSGNKLLRQRQEEERVPRLRRWWTLPDHDHQGREQNQDRQAQTKRRKGRCKRRGTKTGSRQTQDTQGTGTEQTQEPPNEGAAAASTAAADEGTGGKKAKEKMKDFGRKIKDKWTGKTHEQRMEARRWRRQAQLDEYARRQAFRQAYALTIQTNQPQYIGGDLDGRPVYLEPPRSSYSGCRGSAPVPNGAREIFYNEGGGPLPDELARGARFVRPGRFTYPGGRNDVNPLLAYPLGLSSYPPHIVAGMGGSRPIYSRGSPSYPYYGSRFGGGGGGGYYRSGFGAGGMSMAPLLGGLVLGGMMF